MEKHICGNVSIKGDYFPTRKLCTRPATFVVTGYVDPTEKTYHCPYHVRWVKRLEYLGYRKEKINA